MPVDPSPTMRAGRRFIRLHGLEVSRGPFAGLLFPAAAIGAGPLPAKLVGAYELELHAALEERIAAQPSLVVDVGSAEGFFAVGFARRLPQARVIAFDADPEARRLTQLCAQVNNVQARVAQRARATPAELDALELGPDALLFMDCEGCEDVLLDPQRATQLLRTPMIVELHEHLVGGVTGRLTTRFSDSHELTRIWATGREEFHLGAPFASWPEAERAALLDEGRPPAMSWLVMIPRVRSA